MKKVIYIAIAVFALGMVSCSKQDVQPNSPDPVAPIWKSLDNGDNDPAIVNGNSGSSSNEGGITDPNEDPEFTNTGS